MSAAWGRRLLFLALVLPVCASAQSITCTSSHGTASCHDGEGNTTYVICSGDVCVSGTYRQSTEEMKEMLNGYYRPKEHRDALCGGDDASGDLFPTTSHVGVLVRKPLLPQKYCIYDLGMFTFARDKDFLKTFEKNVLDLCNSKKLDAKQCGVLARDIQYQRELDKRDKAGAQ